ncbi:SMP-30/gluconolactonase/LRE family protein [candidate division KSB1 bacterium]|nr:SMP-30/gluconolactonase/LRE family protein [candidate division KSB1 bacterium]
MKKISLLSFPLLCLWLPVLLAQQTTLIFEDFTIRDGLSNNSINALVQTRDGYLWIATKDGLNRFDGRVFRVFKRDPSIPNSLPENYIMSLLESRSGVFWIGTWGGGLCRFDAENEHFTRITAPDSDDDYIQALHEDETGAIWFGTTTGGLHCIDPMTGTKLVFSRSRNHPAGFPAENITSIASDTMNILWLGTLDAGLLQFNPVTHDFRPITAVAQPVWHVLFDSDRGLWIGTEGGIHLYDPVSHALVRHPSIPAAQQDYFTTTIRQSLKDRHGRLWVGTYEYRGLLLFEPTRSRSMRFYHLRQEDDNPNSLISDRIRCIYEDRKGNLWFGTEEGLNKLPKRAPFTQYRYLPRRKTSLGGRVVSSILEGRGQILWVGLGGGGFDRIDLKNNTITHYKHDPNNPNSLSDNDVVTIYADRDEILWIGTSRGGLNRFDPTRGIFTRYLHHPDRPTTISSNWVQQILETRAGLFLVGTNNALQIFDRKNGKFSPYQPAIEEGSGPFPSNLQVNALYEDGDGELWIGTWLDGIWRYNPTSRTLMHYLPDIQDRNSLSASKVTVIYEDSRRMIWIGTHSGGLSRYDKVSDTFVTFTTRDGLPNDVVFGIQEDRRGKLWVSTLNGLVKFDPDGKTFRVYDEADGVVNNQFNWRAAFKNDDGVIYFGGANGLISFHPDSIRIDPDPPPVAFTSFKIFEKEAQLPQPLRATTRIVLPHSQNFFTIEYAALDIAPPHKHRYAYQLQGIDQRWVYPGIHTEALYTDIRPGSYTFRVKASNADGIWSDPISMVITVLPPWWQAWWLKILAAALLLIMIYALYSYRIHELKKIHRIRFNIAGDLHDEIGSNLSSIRVESQMLLQNDKLAVREREQLTAISQTAQETVDAMRDIVWFINPKNDDGENILFKMKETAARLLGGMNWSFSVSPGVRMEWFNLEVRRHIFLIYKEALTNVIRHAEADMCRIEIAAVAEGVAIAIHDDGKGFELSRAQNQGGLHNIARRAEKIGAVLTLTGAPGHGVTIDLSVPYKSRPASPRGAGNIVAAMLKHGWFRIRRTVGVRFEPEK